MNLVDELLHDPCVMARFNSAAGKLHGRIERKHLSLLLKLSKSLFARCGAEPSAKAHFQFIIEEKSSDKHKSAECWQSHGTAQ